MDDSQIALSSKTKHTLSDELDQLCKYYMGMGVSYEDFWHGDYCKLKFIEENYFVGLEQENFKAWMNGIYVYQAFSTVLAAAFSKRSELKYPEKPLNFGFIEDTRSPEEIQAEAIRKAQAQLEAQRKRWIATHKDKNNGT